MRQPSGDPSAVAPPVPIPNTEVKRCSPDDSTCLACAKVGRRQSLCPVSWKQEAGPFYLFADQADSWHASEVREDSGRLLRAGKRRTVSVRASPLSRCAGVES